MGWVMLPGGTCYSPGMARDPIRGSPDLNVVFRKSAAALAEAFRGLADEHHADADATRDLLAAADAIDRALRHLG